MSRNCSPNSQDLAKGQSRNFDSIIINKIYSFVNPKRLKLHSFDVQIESNGPKRSLLGISKCWNANIQAYDVDDVIFTPFNN